MENFIFSVNTVLPVLLIIIVGFCLRRFGVLDADTVSTLNKFAFKVAMPLLLFKDISTMDFYTEFSLSFVLFCTIFSIMSYIVMWFISLRIFSDRRVAGSFAQGSVRGSVTILGVTIVTSIYGSAGIAALMIASAGLVYNIMSVLMLTFCANDGKTDMKSVKSALRGIITNPLIIGIFLGLPFSMLRISLPAPIMSAIGSLGACATPLALLVIGASFEFSDSTTRLRPAIAATVIKLIILPAIAVPLAIFMGFKGAALTSILLMTGTATAPVSYIMSKNIGCDAPLSANIILLTDLFFSITLAAWLFWLKSTGLMLI